MFLLTVFLLIFLYPNNLSLVIFQEIPWANSRKQVKLKKETRKLYFQLRIECEAPRFARVCKLGPSSSCCFTSMSCALYRKKTDDKIKDLEKLANESQKRKKEETNREESLHRLQMSVGSSSLLLNKHQQDWFDLVGCKSNINIMWERKSILINKTTSEVRRIIYLLFE